MGITYWAEITEGQPIGTIYGYKTDGIAQLGEDLSGIPFFAGKTLHHGDRKYVNKNDDNVINIAWIGRLSDDKIYSLVYILDKIIEYKLTNVKFTVIGQGSNKHKLNKYLSSKDIEITIEENITNSFLDNYLLENIDLVFAMGTSALESAKLGIPTILVDPFNKKVWFNYKFKWLHESKNYDLGSFITDNPNENKMNVSDIIQLISNKQGYKDVSYKSYEYTLKNHDMNKIIENLIRLFDSIENSPFIDCNNKIYNKFKYFIRKFK